LSVVVTAIRDSENKIVNFLYIARDVTQERANQKKIFELEKQREMNNLVEDTSHEIKNAITPTLLDASIAETNILNAINTTNEIRKLIEEEKLIVAKEKLYDNNQILEKLKMTNSKTTAGLMRATKILELVKLFTSEDYSRISDEISAFDIKTTCMGLKSVQDSIVAGIDGIEKIENIKFEISTEKEGIMPIGNENLLFLYLMNMLKNSVYEFKNPKEDAVPSENYYFKLVMSEKKKIIDRKRIDTVELIVEDNGPNGMPAEIMDKIFEKKVESYKKTDGTGLYNMSRMIKLWGGECSLIESRPGRTAFAIYLPIKMNRIQKDISDEHKTQQKPMRRDLLYGANEKQLNILILDDDREIGDRLGRILKSMNHKSDYVSTIKDAKTKMIENKYDIVISDYDLNQDQTGLDFLIRVKGMDHNTPCILISANNPNTFDKNKFDMLDDFVAKPITPAKITSVLSKHVVNLYL
jgi:CheY-like chemotaxis protein